MSEPAAAEDRPATFREVMVGREFKAVFAASALSWFGDHAARAAVTALVLVKTESVAYFVVTEALTNVAKHAQASRAVVTVRRDQDDDKLYVSVLDDGRGGAQITDSAIATGLRGLDERVRAARGTFTVSSPPAGPTTITAVLPCG